MRTAPALGLARTRRGKCEAAEKPLLHLWSEQFNLTRRVLAITDHSQERMVLAVERFDRAKPDRLEFVRREFERDARQMSCEEFRARLEPAPCRTVPGRKCRIPTCFRGPGALSFRKLRARVESSDTIDNCLTFALLWLAHARRSSADGAITGLRLVVPKDTSRTVAHRVGALDSHLAVELYEHNSLLDILEKIDPRRAGNVDTWLVPARESEALLQRAKPALESIVAARGHAAIARCAAHSTRDILRDWSIFRDAITQR